VVDNFGVDLCAGSFALEHRSSGIVHRNENMAHVLARKVSGFHKSVNISKYIETVPVISYRYSTCSTLQHSWEPVEKETHTGQVCYMHIISS